MYLFLQLFVALRLLQTPLRLLFCGRFIHLIVHTAGPVAVHAVQIGLCTGAAVECPAYKSTTIQEKMPGAGQDSPRMRHCVVRVASV